MRASRIFREHASPRWAGWLNSRDPEIRNVVLAREISDVGTKPENLPRNMVAAWRNGTRLPTRDTAWRTGQALNRLGYADSGPVALYAAGHYAELTWVLARMSATISGMRRVATLVCGLPPMVDVAVRAHVGMNVDAALGTTLSHYDSLIKRGASLCAAAVDGAGDEFEDAWGNKAARSDGALPEWVGVAVRIAHAVATVRCELPVVKAAVFDWLRVWVEQSGGGSPVIAAHADLLHQFDAWQETTSRAIQIYLARNPKRRTILDYVRPRDTRPNTIHPKRRTKR